ncbi:hypothetical protein BGZ98_007245 [Dissophora globulifera]|nr:hypothetical protein BGZ98_007245 [Dissophora globulifera]
MQSRWFDFGGDAIINTNEHIRLTQDVPSQSGYLWSRHPLFVPHFEVEFEFRVAGKGTGIVGDGFAMWLTKERAEPGPVFGNRDRFEGLGIFFDTYANTPQSHSFPYVMAMVGDGQTSYDNAHDGNANKLGGCQADFRDKNVPTKARITFNVKTGILNLKLQTTAWDHWVDCFTLQDIKLPSSFYLGFTAHTGEVHDTHDIIGVTTTVLEQGSHDNFISQKHNNTPPPSKKSGLGWVFKFFAISGVFGGVIFVAYKASTKNNNKRF